MPAKMKIEFRTAKGESFIVDGVDEGVAIRRDSLGQTVMDTVHNVRMAYMSTQGWRIDLESIMWRHMDPKMVKSITLTFSSVIFYNEG